MNNDDLVLVTKDLTTTSLALAELFDRDHKSIIRTIRNTIKDMDGEEIRRRKIALSSFNQKMPNGGTKEQRNPRVMGSECNNPH